MQKINTNTNDINQALELANYILDYAKVNRKTRWQDGATPESDTDHTVMIGIIGCALAHKMYPELDTGKIAKYGLVHDLVEGYAGDADSFRISADKKMEKDQREKEALNKIKENFCEYSWVYDTICEYDSLSNREARFVKTLDKCLPKITRILNGGKYQIANGETWQSIKSFEDEQIKALKEKYAYDMPELIIFMEEINNISIDVLKN